MEISIIGNGIDVDSTLDAYVKRRIHFVLGRFSSRVERVTVILSHENGPKHGMRKACYFHARLLGLPTVAIKQADSDIRATVDRATDRIGRRVAIWLSPAADSLRGKDKLIGLLNEQP